MSNLQFYVAAMLPTLAVLVGILVNGQRISDLRLDMTARFDALRDTLRADIGRIAAELRTEIRTGIAGTPDREPDRDR